MRFKLIVTFAMLLAAGCFQGATEFKCDPVTGQDCDGTRDGGKTGSGDAAVTGDAGAPRGDAGAPRGDAGAPRGDAGALGGDAGTVECVDKYDCPFKADSLITCIENRCVYTHDDAGAPPSHLNDGGAVTRRDAGSVQPNPQAELAVDRLEVTFGREFGSATWLGTAPQETLLLTNIGLTALTITSATVQGADAAAFTLSRPTLTPSLALYEQTFIRVIFTPTAGRSYAATLTIASDGVNPSITVPLTGRGIAPASPASHGLYDNPECLGSDRCFTPVETGGGCGSNSAVWVGYLEDRSLAYRDDADGDGAADDVDNCPYASNRDQLDADGDGVGNSCDNCAAASNILQADLDGDGTGDLCDADLDGDGIANAVDNCPSLPNPSQADLDNDAAGNRCDADADGDGFPNVSDVCPLLAHTPNEVVLDNNGMAHPQCNPDVDGDGVGDATDNCPDVANTNQLDTDGDVLGDVCDRDIDGDGVLNLADNCSKVANRDQRDDDGDGIGDACDAKYCFVVDPSNRADCLDPQGPFRVHSGGSFSLRTGESVRLPFFANRNGAGITFIWTISKRPAASLAAVDQPTGSVVLSRHFTYAYPDRQVPFFTPDVAGDYTLQLQSTLTIADRVYPDQKQSVSAMIIHATP